MTLKDIAEALSQRLERTVYHGFAPDDSEGDLDEIIALLDFALDGGEHVFGIDEPVMTRFGVTIHARASTQELARTLCGQGYTALLEMGYLSLSPVISLGRDENGRFEAVASIEAHIKP